MSTSRKAISTVVGDKIRFGLLAVKNVGAATAEAIAATSPKTRFKSLADLASSIDSRHLNRRTLESLIMAGACDSLAGSRAQKMGAVESTLEYGHKVMAQSNSHDLFADSSIALQRVEPKLPDVPAWSSSEELAHEKEALGFWISGHPLDRTATNSPRLPRLPAPGWTKLLTDARLRWAAWSRGSTRCRTSGEHDGVHDAGRFLRSDRIDYILRLL